jgi:hypothetical protein
MQTVGINQKNKEQTKATTLWVYPGFKFPSKED